MSIFDFIFPRKCLGCGKTGAYFCSQCLNLLSLDAERICPVCEKPSIGGQTHPRCATSRNLDGFTAIFTYKGLIKKAITKLKYRFITDLASDLIEIFLSFCGEDKSFTHFCGQKNVCLVSVPLHPKRKKWRGFNQAELLGEMIAKNLGISFNPGLLQRVKNTTPQVKLGEKEREKNIQGAFTVSPNSPVIQFSNLLLFDDVWTSGATLKEAAKVLKKNGAKSVWGLTLAR